MFQIYTGVLREYSDGQINILKSFSILHSTRNAGQCQFSYRQYVVKHVNFHSSGTWGKVSHYD